MRKRKISHSRSEESKENDVSHENLQNIKVVRVSSVLWLCVGLAIGCGFGGPWVKQLEDIIYGYR